MASKRISGESAAPFPALQLKIDEFIVVVMQLKNDTSTLKSVNTFQIEVISKVRIAVFTV